MQTHTHPRHFGLRFSHAVLGLAVIHQLIGSEWMAKPWKLAEATATQIALFEMHEWMGLTASALLVLLLVSLSRRYEGAAMSRFLPWTHAEGRAALSSDLRQAMATARRFTPPNAKQTETLAAAVQGIGLLTLLFFAATGTAMWLLEDNLDVMHRIGSIHELGAVPLKLYLLGHAGMAVIHEWRGEGLMSRMFEVKTS